MSLDIVYLYDDLGKPLTKIVNNVLRINLPSQYYIEQEEKKLEIAKKSFNDPLINKQVRAFRLFLSKR